MIKILPPKEDLYRYLDSFQRRVQSCSFPHAPDECTKNEVRRFLENVEHNAALHLDMLALLFITLAQGVQYGVYDKYGERWVAGAVEDESKKSDVYSKFPRIEEPTYTDSFSRRVHAMLTARMLHEPPDLIGHRDARDDGPAPHQQRQVSRCISVVWDNCQTCPEHGSYVYPLLIMIRLTWIVHRDPSLLNPPAPPKQVATRKNLWWWMLHMDMQYSMSLGRPLAISSMGDCSTPEPISRDPINQSLSNYLNQFSVLGRRILSAAYLSNEQIDDYTDQLLDLQQTLPDIIRFDVTWLDKNRALPAWPLEAQAGVLHANLHNFLLLLNRQRIENSDQDAVEIHADLTPTPSTLNGNGVPRGRERVLKSCRALLVAFEFFQTRVRAALICWTLGQMAFNAAMILLLSMLETSDTQDLHIVERTYSTFLEMNKFGVHKLAGAAVERLGIILKEYRAGDPATETVMGQQGMMLLEDPGLQGSLPESFSPLNFQMAGGADTPGMQRSPTRTDVDHRSEPSQITRKKAGRRSPSSRDGKTRPSKRHAQGSPRSLTDRRFSDGAALRPPHKKKRANRGTPSLSLFTKHPGQHSFSVTPQPTPKSETFFSPLERQNLQGFNAINNPIASAVDRIVEYTTNSRPQTFVQSHPVMQNFPHQHQHAASDPGDRSLDFSNNTTPGTGSSDLFDDTFQQSAHDFNFDLHTASLTSYDQPPFSAPAYNLPGGDATASVNHHQQYPF